MATEVVMPKLGLTMERGTVAAWLVPEGGEVVRGEPLLEVITDKVTMEVEAQASGVLRRILVPAGEEVAVATPIAFIAAADEVLPDAPAPEPAAAPAPSSPAPPPGPAAAAERPPHRASPRARRLARDQGLDLSGLTGSGAGGRVVSADVEAALARAAAASAPALAAAASEASPPPAADRVRQVAAQRLAASYREAPHIHLSADIDASWMVRVRRAMADRGQRVTYTDLMVRAAARALTRVPGLNAVYEGGQVQRLSAVDIGLATDTSGGLLVPVLRGAAELDLPALAAASARLVEGARAGNLGPDEYAGGSFTVTNLGMFGVRAFTAILNPPQVGILAVGAVEERVVAVGGGAAAATLGIRPTLTVTLGLDHRAVDGATGARFLQHLRQGLETPDLPD